MRALLPLLAACQAEPVEPYQLSLTCAGEVACVDPTIGVGGFVGPNGYAQLASEDRAVRIVEYGVLGSEVGDGRVVALLDGEIAQQGTIHVAALTGLVLAGPEGPYLDATSDGTYKVVAGKPVAYKPHPMIGAAPSQGTHFYDVSIDGEELDCQGGGDAPTYCTGPIYGDGFALSLAAGTHDLRLRAADGGRDFAFHIVAI